MDDKNDKTLQRPDLRRVMNAIGQHKNGEAVTAHCYHCDGLLTVESQYIESTGATSIKVYCPNGCTDYHHASV